MLRSLNRSWRALRAWHLHNVEILKALGSGRTDCLVVEYADFMNEDRALGRLCRFTGRELKDSRRPALYRHRDTKESWQYKVILLLQKWLFRRDVRRLYFELKKYATLSIDSN